jgi:hypothetical protein
MAWRCAARCAAAVALCAAGAVGAGNAAGSAEAAAKLSLSGPLALTLTGEQLVMERVGSFAWGKAVQRAAALGTAAVFRLAPDAADCSTTSWSGRPASLDGRVVLLDASKDCDAMLPSLQYELQALGASAVLMAAQECLCSEKPLFPSDAFCSNRTCEQLLGPRTAPTDADATDRGLMRIPVAVVSRFQFERAAACVAGSNSTELGLVAGACVNGAGAQLQFHLRWSPGSWAPGRVARPALQLYTSAGELYSPFKSELFTRTLLPQLWSSNALLDVFPLVLDGTRMSRRDSATRKQVAVNCTAVDNDPASAAWAWCRDNCDMDVFGGRFCGMPSALGAGRDGRPVLRENVRQACLLDATRDGTPGRLAFFAYTAQFRADCEKREGISKNCSAKVHARLGLDYEATKACAEGRRAEELLAALVVSPAVLKSQGVVQLPTLAVLGSVVPLGLMWGNLFQGTCAVFEAWPSRPAFCSCLWTETNRALMSLADDELLDKCFSAAQPAPPPSSTSFVWLAVLFAILGGALLALCGVYLWRLRKGKRAHVATADDTLACDTADTSIQLSDV